MAIKQGTGALIALCIFFFIASFLVYHPYFSEAILDTIGPTYAFYRGTHDGGSLIEFATVQLEFLNNVSGACLIIALLMGVIAVLYQLFAEEET